MTATSTHANAPEIARTMRLFVAPGKLGEVRIIRRTGGTMGFFFAFDQINIAATQAANFDTAKAKGLYLVMNEIDPATLNGRECLSIQNTDLTKDIDISRRRWVLIDFDPSSSDRGANDSATDAEKAAAMELREVVYEYLRGLGFPDAVFADSGNGGHLLFRVDLANDWDGGGLIARLLKSLAKRFSTDRVGVDISVHNAARITKLYGSTARKGDDRPERPHRVSALQSVPDCADGIVTRELIEAVLQELGGGSLLEQPREETNGHGGNLDGFTPDKGKLILPDTFPVGGRHDTLLKFAGAVRSFGSNETEIVEFLRIINRTRCGGGKPDDELQKIARDYALKDCNLPMKALIESDDQAKVEAAERQQKLKQSLEYASKRLASGDALSEIVLKLKTTIEQLTAQNEPQTFNTMTSAELDAAELSTEYLVSDVLARHQSTIIAAAKKSLKTNIAIDLTLSLASRCYFLGKFHIPTAVRVALMSGESGDATIQETAKRIARSKLWPNLADYENAVWSFDLPRLGQPQTKLELTKFIADHALDVLIIDPAYLCLDLGDDAGNLFSVGKKLRELTDIQHATGCTVVIVHHNKKSPGAFSDPFAVPELESIAWSGFQEWARQWLLIGRREKYNPEAAGSHRLWLSAGGSAGHSGLWAVDIEEGNLSDQGGRRWEVVIETASTAIAETIEQREQSKVSRDEQKTKKRIAADAEKLLKVYQKLPQGDTPKAVRETAGLNPPRFAPANRKLIDDGLIEACRIKKHTREEDAYRLRTSAAGTGGTGGTVPEQIPAVPAGSVVVELTPYKGEFNPPPHTHQHQHKNNSEDSSGIKNAQAAELFPAGAA